MTDAVRLAEIENWVIARNAAFEADDVDWARGQLPPGTPDKVVEVAFHKARVICRAVSLARREESRIWLKDRGMRVPEDE